APARDGSQPRLDPAEFRHDRPRAREALDGALRQGGHAARREADRQEKRGVRRLSEASRLAVRRASSLLTRSPLPLAGEGGERSGPGEGRRPGLSSFPTSRNMPAGLCRVTHTLTPTLSRRRLCRLLYKKAGEALAGEGDAPEHSRPTARA